jgi:hypothetical protein
MKDVTRCFGYGVNIRTTYNPPAALYSPDGLKNLSQFVGARTPALGPPPAVISASLCRLMVSMQFWSAISWPGAPSDSPRPGMARAAGPVSTSASVRLKTMNALFIDYPFSSERLLPPGAIEANLISPKFLQDDVLGYLHCAR